jgi:hypothetical protein
LYCDAYSFGFPLCASAFQQGLPGNSDWVDNLEFATLYFNNNLYGMYSNFDNIYVNQGEKTNQIKVPNINGQNLVTLQDPITGITKTFWIVQQDYESTSTLWSPIESIVAGSVPDIGKLTLDTDSDIDIEVKRLRDEIIIGENSELISDFNPEEHLKKLHLIYDALHQ